MLITDGVNSQCLRKKIRGLRWMQGWEASSHWLSLRISPTYSYYQILAIIPCIETLPQTEGATPMTKVTPIIFIIRDKIR